MVSAAAPPPSLIPEPSAVRRRFPWKHLFVVSLITIGIVVAVTTVLTVLPPTVSQQTKSLVQIRSDLVNVGESVHQQWQGAYRIDHMQQVREDNATIDIVLVTSDKILPQTGRIALQVIDDNTVALRTYNLQRQPQILLVREHGPLAGLQANWNSHHVSWESIG